MRIPKKTWNKYITDLRKISDKAAELMTSYLETHDVSSPAGRQQAIEYAYALATKYGEGTSALACEMYDSVVAASGKKLPPAEPAATATFNEVARAVNGSMLYSKRPDVVGSSVGRLVKTAGVDTTMRNAIRDGAEWAWVPSGDTCAFCIALASQGWVKASEKVMKGNHAEHIHNNCDCTFSIRFDGKSSVEGYDPDALRRQYYAADGSTPTERINAMRRAQYAANKDEINAQKRLAYRERRILKMKKGVELPEDFGVPNPGETISRKELEEIKKNAKKAGIIIETSKYGEYGGFETYRGDPDVINELIKTASENKELWGEHNSNMSIRLGYKSFGNFEDLATIDNGVICINKDIFDDSKYLKRYYDYVASHGTKEELTWFVPGTDYRSIILHEIGHRVMAYDKLSYRKIRDIIVTRYGSVEEFCLKHLSEYAMINTRGRYSELLSEMASALLGSDIDRKSVAEEIIMEVFGS